ncbi:1632_t:CDS:2, partial [Gigaspora margarita]
MTLTHIRISKNEIPNVRLSKIDYERYKSKFPSSLKQGVPFSNQSKIHDQLRNIKDKNNFTDEIIDNVSEITIDVDNYSSLADTLDSVSETYTSDDEQSINSMPSRSSDNERLIITNKIAKVQTTPIDNNSQQLVVTKSKKYFNDRQNQTQTIYVLPCNNDQKYKKLKKILTAINAFSILVLFWYHQKTNNTTISNLIETINAEIFEK